MTISLRAAIQALVLGTAGTTRTMTSGRFLLRSPDCTLETHPVDSVERKVEVQLMPSTPFNPRNGLDNRNMRTQRLTVRVAYALTAAGGDATEAVSEHSGAGTRDAIADRAETDAYDLETVLTWHENRAGNDPALCAVVPVENTRTTLADRVILECRYDLVTEATQPGSYAP